MSKRHNACEIREKSGFTLIELLVVIAIIALLLSIVMPALSKVKESARKIVCGSQMRQYSFGVYMYSTDNGQIPWFGLAWDSTDGDIPSAAGWLRVQESYWFNVVNKYMEAGGELDFGKKHRVGDDDGKDTYKDLRKCPSWREGEEMLPSGVRKTREVWIGVNYGGSPNGPFVYEYKGEVSDVLAGTVSARNEPTRFTKIKQPAGWAMLLDTDNNFVYSPNQWKLNLDGDGDGTIDSYYATGRLYSGAQPKAHKGGMNMALCDGHVEWVKFDDIWEWDNSNTAMTHQFWRQ